MKGQELLNGDIRIDAPPHPRAFPQLVGMEVR